MKKAKFELGELIEQMEAGTKEQAKAILEEHKNDNDLRTLLWLAFEKGLKFRSMKLLKWFPSRAKYGLSATTLRDNISFLYDALEEQFKTKPNVFNTNRLASKIEQFLDFIPEYETFITISLLHRNFKTKVLSYNLVDEVMPDLFSKEFVNQPVDDQMDLIS